MGTRHGVSMACTPSSAQLLPMPSYTQRLPMPPACLQQHPHSPAALLPPGEHKDSCNFLTSQSTGKMKEKAPTQPGQELFVCMSFPGRKNDGIW